MYLERHVGEIIEVVLKYKDNWSELFTQYFDPYDSIIAELIAVDPAGIWIRGYLSIVEIVDKDGNYIDKSLLKEMESPASFFINWMDTESILVHEDQYLFEGKRQFYRLRFNETVDDVI